MSQDKERIAEYDVIFAVEKVSKSNFRRTPFRMGVYDALWLGTSGLLSDERGNLPLKVILTDATCSEMLTIAKLSGTGSTSTGAGTAARDDVTGSNGVGADGNRGGGPCDSNHVDQFIEYVRGQAGVPHQATFEVVRSSEDASEYVTNFTCFSCSISPCFHERSRL
jgi:hypothetical protein